MYTLSVKSEFSAAHSLRGYKGKCEALHGHNWKVEVVVAAEKVDRQGLVIDFHIIKKALKDTLDGLDHKYLNTLAYFKKHNPTSENLARYIYEKLNRTSPALREDRHIANCLPAQAGKLQKVTVWESDNCAAAYAKQ